MLSFVLCSFHFSSFPRLLISLSSDYFSPSVLFCSSLVQILTPSSLFLHVKHTLSLFCLPNLHSFLPLSSSQFLLSFILLFSLTSPPLFFPFSSSSYPLSVQFPLPLSFCPFSFSILLFPFSLPSLFSRPLDVITATTHAKERLYSKRQEDIFKCIYIFSLLIII